MKYLCAMLFIFMLSSCGETEPEPVVYPKFNSDYDNIAKAFNYGPVLDRGEANAVGMEGNQERIVKMYLANKKVIGEHRINETNQNMIAAQIHTIAKKLEVSEHFVVAALWTKEIVHGKMDCGHNMKDELDKCAIAYLEITAEEWGGLSEHMLGIKAMFEIISARSLRQQAENPHQLFKDIAESIKFCRASDKVLEIFKGYNNKGFREDDRGGNGAMELYGIMYLQIKYHDVVQGKWTHWKDRK